MIGAKTGIYAGVNAYEPEFEQLLLHWQGLGYSLPTNQDALNALVKGLKAANAWSTADLIRVWKIAGGSDGVLHTNWADVTKHTGEVIASQPSPPVTFQPPYRISGAGYFGSPAGSSAYNQKINLATQGVNFTLNDCMRVLMPIGDPDFLPNPEDVTINSGILAGGTGFFMRQMIPLNVRDYWSNDVNPTVVEFVNGDILFFGRKSNTTKFSKVNLGAVVDAAGAPVSLPDGWVTQFGRNQATGTGIQIGASDAAGQGYAFDWYGRWSDVDLDAMYAALDAFRNS